MPRRDYAGPEFLSAGFRPFFLGGAVWAAVAMVIWVGAVAGWWTAGGDYGAVAWHAHEFLFGYVGAVMTGFLLTAIPNWTGRLPIQGQPLLSLFLLWFAGRAGLLLVDVVGVIPAAVVDGLYLPTLAVVIIREVAVGKNWRNLRVVALVALLAIVNIAFHVEVINSGAADYAARAGVAVVLMLIVLIGGRIVPSFTRNWLVKQGAVRLPAPFSAFDISANAVAAAALLSWVIAPDMTITGMALSIAGVAQTVRLARWAGWPTWREPLVLILHVGYALVPAGFFAVGVASLWPEVMAPSGALHVWTTGGMAVMTLAVMTRVTLGHTGRILAAGTITSIIYLAALVAVVARVTAAAFPAAATALLHLAASGWIVGFGGFALWYGRMLVWPRLRA